MIATVTNAPVMVETPSNHPRPDVVVSGCVTQDVQSAQPTGDPLQRALFRSTKPIRYFSDRSASNRPTGRKSQLVLRTSTDVGHFWVFYGPRALARAHCPRTSSGTLSYRNQQGALESVSQPVLIFLRGPTALTHQHPVHIPPRKHPEDIAGSCVIESRQKPCRVAKRDDHDLLPLIPQALSLSFQFREFRGDHTRASQQIKRCTLGIVNLPGDSSRKPQTSFRGAGTQCLPYGVLIFTPKRGLIEKFGENPRFRPKDGIDSLCRHFRPLRDRFDGHAVIAFALQKLPRGFNNPSTVITRQPLANQ
jgi:hypothetical protein